jgi:Cu-processing system permease protein
MNLGPVMAVTLNTLRETVRDRVLYAFVLFALVVTLAGVLLGSLSVYQDERILEDLGLFTISTIGGIIAIFVGTNLVYKELDRRTIYLIFTKPISRWQFIWGKFLGLSLCILIVTMLMGVFLMGTVLVTSPAADRLSIVPVILQALGLIYLELLLVIALATFFSTFSTPLMSVLFTLGLWLAGHMSQALLALSRLAHDAGVKTLFQYIYYLIPDLATLTQMRSSLMSPPNQLPMDSFLLVAAYIVGYIMLLLSFATVITEQREFQ